MTDVALPSGIQHDELDESVRPQDDLFRHVNGRWIERTEIPADKARYGSFLVLHEEAEQAVREIIEESQQAEPGTEARKVGDLYASFMDEQHAELLGATPIAAQLMEVVARRLDSVAARDPRPPRAPGRHRLRPALRRQRPRRPRALPRVRRAGRHRPARRELLPRRAVRGHPHGLQRPPRAHVRARPARRPGRPRRARLRPRDRRSPRLTGTTWHPATARRRTTSPVGTTSSAAASVDLNLWRDAMGVPAGAFDEIVRAPALVRGRPRRAAHRGPPGGVEGLARLAGDPLERRLPLERLRRGELRLLRPHAHGHPADARALEARRLARRGRHGRGRRPHLRRAALPARGEGGDGRAGREPRRGLPPVDHRARLDGQEDPRPGRSTSSRSSRPRSASR